jgi:hypothetical protein
MRVNGPGWSSKSAELARLLLQSGVRGRTRMTMLLARILSGLQHLSVETGAGASLFLDLRIASSHCLLVDGSFELAEQEVMRQVVRRGDVAFDVGAHFGVHTVLLSQLVGQTGQVHAFEPNVRVLPVLRRTVELLENSELHACALSDRAGAAVDRRSNVLTPP